MGKLAKIRRQIKKNPNAWMYRQGMPNAMFRAKGARFRHGAAIPHHVFRGSNKNYRMFVRKTIMDTLGYTENMIE